MCLGRTSLNAPASYTLCVANKVVVEAFWDPEAEVWVASSRDVPGLATEADSIESLLGKLGDLVPELMRLNGASQELPPTFDLVTSHQLHSVG